MNPVFSYRSREFGRHVRSCRKARGLTQEALAKVSKLSADTIRRLEQGSFSPSLETLNKLSVGLRMSLSTLFAAFEICERNVSRELTDLINMTTPRQQLLLMRVIPMMCELVDAGDEDQGDQDGD